MSVRKAPEGPLVWPVLCRRSLLGRVMSVRNAPETWLNSAVSFRRSLLGPRVISIRKASGPCWFGSSILGAHFGRTRFHFGSLFRPCCFAGSFEVFSAFNFGRPFWAARFHFGSIFRPFHFSPSFKVFSFLHFGRPNCQ